MSELKKQLVEHYGPEFSEDRLEGHILSSLDKIDEIKVQM